MEEIEGADEEFRNRDQVIEQGLNFAVDAVRGKDLVV